ncbi:hypothetical protein HMPREF1990_00446 [Porphyromonas gingivalis W4087]|nr:hypothetical protein HMPREF1990_00446 [Porphyromonas gingivalis W4087]
MLFSIDPDRHIRDIDVYIARRNLRQVVLRHRNRVDCYILFVRVIGAVILVADSATDFRLDSCLDKQLSDNTVDVKRGIHLSNALYIANELLNHAWQLPFRQLLGTCYYVTASALDVQRVVHPCRYDKTNALCALSNLVCECFTGLCSDAATFHLLVE